MKKLLFFALLAFSIPVLQTGCGTPPSQRVAAVQTLKAVGQTAETAVATSAQLYSTGAITAAQARQVMDLYNQKFQPAYRLAVSAVQNNLDASSPQDLIDLSTQIATLVLQFQSHKP